MVAEEAHERELRQQQQQQFRLDHPLDASGAEQKRQVTKEQLAHLLVSGVSTLPWLICIGSNGCM
jgi:hypothetical protein